MHSMRALSVGSFFLLSAAAAVAQSQEAPTQSLQQLLAAGFEIKAVTAVAPEMLGFKAENGAGKALVTLQHEASIAVCELALINWDRLPKASVENQQLCSVIIGQTAGTSASSAAPTPATSGQAPSIAVPAIITPPPGASSTGDDEYMMEGN